MKRRRHSERRGISGLERLEALLANDALYELADLVPELPEHVGGRRRDYPSFMIVLYEALISVWGSARRVEAELAHPLVWELIRTTVRRRFPRKTEWHLPAQPPRRHHYRYLRNRYLSRPDVLASLVELHRRLAADQARELGLLDPNGPGSWTHPDLSRMLYADGKVITPLWKAQPGDARLDRTTGELTSRRYDPDAGLHFEGTGEAAWGTKFVLVAVRSEHPHGRILLDVDWVAKPGAEAATAMNCFDRLAPDVPGAQGVLYDTALRGVHHQRLLRELGLLSVNRITAASGGGPRTGKRGARRRQVKSTYLEDKTITLPNGIQRTVRLFARDGAVGIGELTDTGDIHFIALRRMRVHRVADKSGLYRWYVDYELPETYGSGLVTIRLHGTADDRKRRFNRTENVRPIPPGDPDFERIFPRRNDAESINRFLDDTMWLGRAHSLGHARQHLNLLGFALMVNALALHQHRRRRPHQQAA